MLSVKHDANMLCQAQTPCPPGCVCDERSNWKIEELSLINLQEIEILKLRGSEHEASFVKRLFNWATALNKITVFLDSSTTERKAKDLFQMFESLSRPEYAWNCIVTIRCHMHPDIIGHRVHQYLKLLFLEYEPWSEKARNYSCISSFVIFLLVLCWMWD